MGLCLQWLDGAGARGRKPSGSWRKPLLVPEVRPQGRRSRRGGTLRGVAVCLCFSAIREISRGRYQGAPFGVPSPLILSRGEKDKSPTRAAARERKTACDERIAAGRQTMNELRKPAIWKR